MGPVVVISGATGFLGKNLCMKLSNLNYKVIALTRSSSNIQSIKYEECISLDDPEWPKKLYSLNPLVFIHCAAIYSNGSNDDLVKEVNFELSKKIYEEAKKSHVSYFINCDTSLAPEVNSYAFYKKSFSDFAKNDSSSKMKFINLVLEQFYGPNDGRFISSLITKFKNQESAIDLTLGEQVRDFIFIDDLIDAFTVVLNHLHKFESNVEIPIGTGSGSNIRDIVVLTQKLTQNNTTKLNWGALPYRKHESMFSVADITFLQKLGWNPQVSLDLGIKLSIEKMR